MNLVLTLIINRKFDKLLKISSIKMKNKTEVLPQNHPIKRRSKTSKIEKNLINPNEKRCVNRQCP